MEMEFKFPANIKQMGNVDKDLKIYLEDYVYTYLYQFAKNGTNSEKLAVLVGKHFIVNDVDVCVISGAIEAKETERNGDKTNFTEESWSYINRQLELYFKDFCVVGWVHIQPDYGTYLMPSEEAFHKECFKEKWQPLFIMDPREKLDDFYCLSEDGYTLRRVRGYFIYYDKNEAMQNYMIENSSTKARELEEKEEATIKASGKQAVLRLLGIKGNKINKEELKKDENGKIERIDAAYKIREKLKEKEEIKFLEMRKKQIIKAVAGLSICFISGVVSINLLNNRNRIKTLENEINSMQISYSEINEQISKEVEEKTMQVFASQKEEEKQEDAVIELVSVIEETETIDNNYNVYWVEDGDSLWEISEMFYDSGDNVAQIMEANGITDENKIFMGDRLIIPR